ncbi:hypothetical protein [Prosthecomicrobium sp. N25]|uniref:hypothetical protein n=1 Tax=Prosthecomicrobium sp. N25 TaxID=3129254 RepID=UPI0030782CFF
MIHDSRRTRPVLDSDRDIHLALEKIGPFAPDRSGLYRLILENFTVDLDLLAAAMSRQHDDGLSALRA